MNDLAIVLMFCLVGFFGAAIGLTLLIDLGADLLKLLYRTARSRLSS